MSQSPFARQEGLVPAAYTPLNAEGELHLDAIAPLHALYRANGLSTVFICGSTGESASLTTHERKQVAEAWSNVAIDGFDVLVHVGHNCQRDARDLAAHAESIGAAGIAAFAPHYFRPAAVQDLVDFFEPIASAAPSLPFYFYDIPAMTGVSFPTDRFIRLAADRMANFTGVKYTSADLMRLQACVQMDGGRYHILFGCDEALLAALSLGVRGAVGSTYNYAAPLYQRVIDAFDRGDLESARRWQLRAVDLVDVLLRFGVLRAGKAIMGMIGVDCGPPRSPLTPLSPKERQGLREQLDAIEFDQWSSRPASSRAGT